MLPCTAQHSTAQHSTAQHSTAQHSTAQHSTAQHSTAQLKNYVISLNTATIRRQHIINEFTQHDIPFEFFDAITPALGLDESIQRLFPNMAYQYKLSASEKACFMSHVLLWEKCIKENLPFISIFEDDIKLGKDAALFLKETQWIEERFVQDKFFLIKTETFLEKCGTKSTTLSPVNFHRFPQLTSIHYGAAGYILSQPAAQYLLNKLRQTSIEQVKPLDHLLFRYYDQISKIKVYQLEPAICVQADRLNKDEATLVSQITHDRSIVAALTKDKLSIIQKLRREIKKIPLAIRKLSFKIIPFE